MSGATRAIALDAFAVAAVVAVALVAAARPAPMLLAVVAVTALRTFAWTRLVPADVRGHSMAAEVALVAGCAALGGFNDWMSVVVHRVYSYRVPSDLAPWSSIPLWMWVFWGLVLRSVITVVAPEPATAAAAPKPLRLAIALALVFVTRRSIYRFHADPWLSWLPFAAALAVWGGVLGAPRRAWTRAAAVAAAGSLTEALWIRAGGVHRYELGWFFGVPLWIVLWWVLGALVLAEASAAVSSAAARRRGR